MVSNFGNGGTEKCDYGRIKWENIVNERWMLKEVVPRIREVYYKYEREELSENSAE